jgi:hypothetical protein
MHRRQREAVHSKGLRRSGGVIARLSALLHGDSSDGLHGAAHLVLRDGRHVAWQRDPFDEQQTIIDAKRQRRRCKLMGSAIAVTERRSDRPARKEHESLQRTPMIRYGVQALPGEMLSASAPSAMVPGCRVLRSCPKPRVPT